MGEGDRRGWDGMGEDALDVGGCSEGEKEKEGLDRGFTNEGASEPVIKAHTSSMNDRLIHSLILRSQPASHHPSSIVS